MFLFRFIKLNFRFGKTLNIKISLFKHLIQKFLLAEPILKIALVLIKWDILFYEKCLLNFCRKTDIGRFSTAHVCFGRDEFYFHRRGAVPINLMVLYLEYGTCHAGERIQKEFPIIQIFLKIGVGRVSIVINK
jgi:hypothetical protein